VTHFCGITGPQEHRLYRELRACANVAQMLLSRTSERHQELALLVEDLAGAGLAYHRIDRPNRADL
jgi:hypothetical protein